MVKNLPANAGDVGLIPGSGRSPGGGNGNPLQYSCLESSTDREAWQARARGVAELDIIEQLSTVQASFLVTSPIFPMPAWHGQWFKTAS